MNIFKKIRAWIIKTWQHYDEMSREAAVETLEAELSEMENIFGLLVLGSFVGLPSPPMQITLDLMPEMERHFILMLNKVETANAPISDLVSTFDVV